MVKAEQKKNENISEYIIHMFKSEDLVRTFEFDLNQINEFVISHIPIKGNEKKSLILWYASLIETMRSEKIQKTGHLNELQDLVSKLSRLHIKLQEEESDYKKIVSKANPYIQNQIEKSDQTISNSIQICLNAVYGFLLLKLNAKKVSSDQQEMLEIFGDLLSYLSYKYKDEIKKMKLIN